MGIIECDHAHCQSDICTIYNACETRKKYGPKTEDLTPLQVALQEKEALLKQLAELKTKVEATPIPTPKPEPVIPKKAGRPPKGKV